MAETTPPKGFEIVVRLMGKAAEMLTPNSTRFDHVHDIKVRLPENIRTTTPAEIIKLIADQNPLLRDQIVRGDGTPRSSTRILLNGAPPRSLDQRLEVVEREKGEIIVIIFGPVIVVVDGPIIVVVVVPCDG